MEDINAQIAAPSTEILQTACQRFPADADGRQGVSTGSAADPEQRLRQWPPDLAAFRGKITGECSPCVLSSSRVRA
ncbi:hypothetical protein GCM10010420_12450 [Streptomyces glaucosporus]|uniref:Uncharacterized protein n=1 Tax=Streptomyces glaucosporus TaxID=284044 RepID=A0ABN3HXL9_9ACTN